MRADLIAAGLHFGWMALIRATMADTWGQAMEVPDSNLKWNGESLFFLVYGWAACAADHEARMLTPGAVISGCGILDFDLKMCVVYLCTKSWNETLFLVTLSTDGERELGPLEEKSATLGETCCPTAVFGTLYFITGLLFQDWKSSLIREHSD